MVAKFSLTGQRADFPTGTEVFGKTISVKTVLVNDSASDTPVLEGVAIHESVRPAFILEFTFVVKAANNVAKRDGSVDRRRAETIRQQLQEVVSQVQTVEVIFPHEQVETITFVDYKEVLRDTSKRYGAEWDIVMKGIQYRTLSTPGSLATTSGLTYATLEQYTYGELESQIL